MPPRIAVGRVGFQVRDAPDLVIDRPRGSGDWLFIWFHEPVVIGAERRRASGPVWALYPPTAPQWFSGAGRTMVTSWFHCVGIDALVERLGLPRARPRAAHTLGPLAPLMRELHRERMHAEPGWQEVAAALVDATLRRLARAGRATQPARRGRSNARLRDVRERMHAHLAQRWTAAGLARLAGVSPSRLTVLWRDAFGATPIADLIDARLSRACWLIEGTAQPLAAIAASVGFADQAHFSRTFRARLGRPPSRWPSASRAEPAPPAR